MSINAYLKPEIISEKGFTRHKSAIDVANFEGTDLKNSGGRWFFILSSLLELIPEHLEKYVDQISFIDYISPNQPRALGLYKCKSAIAHVSIYNDEQPGKRKLTMVGTKISDMLELYQNIMSGKAFPSEPWDQPQIVPEVAKNNFPTRILVCFQKFWDEHIRIHFRKSY